MTNQNVYWNDSVPVTSGMHKKLGKLEVQCPSNQLGHLVRCRQGQTRMMVDVREISGVDDFIDDIKANREFANLMGYGLKQINGFDTGF